MISLDTNISRLVFTDKNVILVSTISGLILAIAAALDFIIAGAVLPFLLFIIFALTVNPRIIIYLLFFVISLSSAVSVGSGITIDFPGEPILLLLSLITICFIIVNGLPKRILNAISTLIALHIFWIFISALFALSPLISLKFLLAKAWYVLPFYILPFYVIHEEHHLRQILKCFVAGLAIAAIFFFFSHLADDLSYASRTNAGIPIWRNHVNYACTLVISLPSIWYLRKSSRHPDRWLYLVVMMLFIVFIYFAYARIAYICMAAALAYYLILKFDLTHITILSSILIVCLCVLYLINNNQYLHLAPNYERTIMQDDFEKKISSTITGEDISTMERVHRWVAGVKMLDANPFTGVGPGNFYDTYKPYTIYSFETYVSNNPDRSGIHNYYLMILAEQGYIGLTILGLLIISVLVKVQKIFRSLGNSAGKNIIILAGTTISMILIINTVNDMMEVIKVGSLFFFFTFVISYFSFELDEIDE